MNEQLPMQHAEKLQDNKLEGKNVIKRPFYLDSHHAVGHTSHSQWWQLVTHHQWGGERK